MHQPKSLVVDAAKVYVDAFLKRARPVDGDEANYPVHVAHRRRLERDMRADLAQQHVCSDLQEVVVAALPPVRLRTVEIRDIAAFLRVFRAVAVASCGRSVTFRFSDGLMRGAQECWEFPLRVDAHVPGLTAGAGSGDAPLHLATSAVQLCLDSAVRCGGQRMELVQYDMQLASNAVWVHAYDAHDDGILSVKVDTKLAEEPSTQAPPVAWEFEANVNIASLADIVRAMMDEEDESSDCFVLGLARDKRRRVLLDCQVSYISSDGIILDPPTSTATPIGNNRVCFYAGDSLCSLLRSDGLPNTVSVAFSSSGWLRLRARHNNAVYVDLYWKGYRV